MSLLKIFLVVCLSIGLTPGGLIHAENTNPITLADCLSETVEHNEDIIHWRKDLERAAGTRIEIRSQDLAQLGGQGNLGWRNGSLYGRGGPYALMSASFSQPILNAAIVPAWKRGNSEVLVVEQQLNVTLSDRLLAARIFYLRAQRLEELIRLNEELDRRLQSNIDGEQLRQNAESTGPRPSLQAKGQWLDNRAALTDLHREDDEVRTLMAQIMGRPATDLPRPAEPMIYQNQTNDWVAEGKIALAKRADLQFLRSLVRLAEEDRQITAAGYFPYVSLVASGLYLPGNKKVYQATPIIEGQIPLGTEGRYGALVSWQIIDNGSVTGPTRELASVRDQYKISLRQIEENIPRELIRQAHELETAGARLKALKESVVEAGENLGLIEERIKLGEAIQLDFSDAQRNLVSVQRGIVDAIFVNNFALAQIDAITGRYLEFAEPSVQR